jgi:hypothetical protein
VSVVRKSQKQCFKKIAGNFVLLENEFSELDFQKMAEAVSSVSLSYNEKVLFLTEWKARKDVLMGKLDLGKGITKITKAKALQEVFNVLKDKGARVKDPESLKKVLNCLNLFFK